MAEVKKNILTEEGLKALESELQDLKVNRRKEVAQKIKDLEYDEEMEYKLVGSTEANSLKGKISNESPVGKALIGAKKGHTVMVETPAGLLKYKILEITKN